MRYLPVPVLTEEDRSDLIEFGMGLDDDTARVLGYLLLRRMDDVERDAATRLEIQLGTGLGRDATIKSTNLLSQRDLLSTTTAETEQGKQTRKAWTLDEGKERIESRVLERHASDLVSQGLALVEGFQKGVVAGSPTKASSESRSATVALNWQENAVHFPILVSDEMDFYREKDITIELQANTGSGQAVSELMEGQADLAIAGPVTVMRTLMENQPIVPVALLYQRSMAVMYTLRKTFGEPFDSVEQLRNRRVVMAQNSETERIAQVYLSQADIANSVDLIHVEGEERNALLEGDADVAAGVFTDTVALQNEGYTADSVLIAEDFPLPGPALITTNEMVESRQNLLEDFLVGTMRGWAHTKRNPTEVSNLLAERAEGPSGDRVLNRLIETFGTASSVKENGWGWQTESDWNRATATVNHLKGMQR